MRLLQWKKSQTRLPSILLLLLRAVALRARALAVAQRVAVTARSLRGVGRLARTAVMPTEDIIEDRYAKSKVDNNNIEYLLVCVTFSTDKKSTCHWAW